jgi:RNA polymerase sigma-70 factor, ECF subfamily
VSEQDPHVLTPTAAQLMDRIQGDDEAAFADLFTRYTPQALRLASAICHDEGRADQAVQEAFVSVWTSRQTYRSERGEVDTWLMSIVRHRAIAVARTNGQHDRRTAPPMELDELLDGEDVPAAAVAVEDAARLRAMLLRLPFAQREVITLAFYAGFTHREISALLGLPAGTVKGRMRLGLKKLRAAVDP